MPALFVMVGSAPDAAPLNEYTTITTLLTIRCQHRDSSSRCIEHGHRRKVKWGRSGSRLSIHVRSRLNQVLRTCLVSHEACILEWGFAFEIGGVEVRAAALGHLGHTITAWHRHLFLVQRV